MKRGIVLFLAAFLLLGSMFVVSAITIPDPCSTLSGKICMISSCTTGYQLSFGTCSSGQVCCAVNESWDTIMKLSTTTNAHGEVWNETHYNTIISYRDVFRVNSLVLGPVYTGSNPHDCKSPVTNGILKLSEATNAHGANWSSTTYPISVCYGNMSCAARTNNCLGDERCIVTIATNTGEPMINGHLAKCDVVGNYTTKICCNASSAAPVVLGCTDYTTKDSCRAATCSWTPPSADTTAEGGGCCPKDYPIWDPVLGCGESRSTICTLPWTYTIAAQLKARTFSGTLFSANGPLDKDNKKYCSQVTGEVNWGIWLDIQKF